MDFELPDCELEADFVKNQFEFLNLVSILTEMVVINFKLNSSSNFDNSILTHWTVDCGNARGAGGGRAKILRNETLSSAHFYNAQRKRAARLQYF